MHRWQVVHAAKDTSTGTQRPKKCVAIPAWPLAKQVDMFVALIFLQIFCPYWSGANAQSCQMPIASAGLGPGIGGLDPGTLELGGLDPGIGDLDPGTLELFCGSGAIACRVACSHRTDGRHAATDNRR